jgi:dUTP diphosphatase
MKLNVKALHPDAIMPQYLHALIENGYVKVRPEMPIIIRTGLAFEIPEDHVMLIFSRSGHGFENDIRLANCIGVIDSDYRGEVQVKLTNDNTEGRHLTFKKGDRIAQAMIVPVERIELVPVAELSSTERGENGFGSTGAERSVRKFFGKPQE